VGWVGAGTGTGKFTREWGTGCGWGTFYGDGMEMGKFVGDGENFIYRVTHYSTRRPNVWDIAYT